MDSHQKYHQLFRILLFAGVFLILFSGMTAVFSNDHDSKSIQAIRGFYNEPSGTLHGVYIGSSNCYAFWNPLVAWHNYGIAIHPYACAGLPFYATEYIIRDARKTQPDALYIVNVNSVDEDDLGYAHLYRIVCNMPSSLNKKELVNTLCDLLGASNSERFELMFPWIRTRLLWGTYLNNGLFHRLEGLKAASHYSSYLKGKSNLTEKYTITEIRTQLPDSLVECVDRLLDYCDEEDIKVLFVSVPRAEESQAKLGRINMVCDMIRDRGHDVLYLTDQVDKIGLDLARDFYNRKHMNIHGSIKFTNYLSEYLVEAYNLVDRRSGTAYESWNEAWERYVDIIAPYVLTFETNVRCRDYTIAAPKKLTVNPDKQNTSAVVEWQSVDGADGYRVYRKAGKDGAWLEVSATEACVFKDTVCQEGVQYYYTVVPVKHSEERVYFGNFSPSGKRIMF